MISAITYHIVSNPRAHQKLVAELDEAFQANPLQGASTYDEVKNLPYLAACIDVGLLFCREMTGSDSSVALT